MRQWLCAGLLLYSSIKKHFGKSSQHKVLQLLLARVAHVSSLQWRHNERDGVLNHQPHDCLLNRLFRSKKTSKLRLTGLCEGNSPVTGEFTAQRVSNAENVWWRHHVRPNIITGAKPSPESMLINFDCHSNSWNKNQCNSNLNTKKSLKQNLTSCHQKRSGHFAEAPTI